jgi:hypothetical protein
MKAKILDIDKPNANNRIYPRSVIEKAIKKYKEEMVDQKRALIAHEQCSSPLMDLEKTYGIVDDIFIENDSVFIEFHALGLPISERITHLIKSEILHPVTSGTGTIDENGKIGDDYNIGYIFLTNDPSYDYQSPHAAS